MRTETIRQMDERGNFEDFVPPDYAQNLVNSGTYVEVYQVEFKYGERRERFLGIQRKPASMPANANNSPCTLTDDDIQAYAGIGEKGQIGSVRRKVHNWAKASMNNNAITVVPRLCLS